MRYDLAQMVKRTTNTRRKSITFRPIVAPSTMATNLYQSSYRPIIEAWSALIPTIMAEYERTLSAMTTDSPADIGALFNRHEGDLLRLVLTLKLRLAEWGFRVERFQRNRWVANVKAGTGVDISMMIGAGDVRTTLGASIEANVGLVKSVSEQTRQRISNEVFQGLRQRRPARETAKALSEAVGMSRKRALRIASDQNTKITSALNEERAMQAGIEGYAWVASGKVHYREEHRARDGKIYRYDEPPADGSPGTAINCGCTSRARLSLDPEDEF
jgi:SPP1 gp7 family putative phage head morphogenesis protein